MSNEYLDIILEVLNNEPDRLFDYEILKTFERTKNPELKTSIELLKNKGYIKTYVSGVIPYGVSITSAGSKFLHDGGFTQEAKLKSSPLDSNRIAEKSNRIANRSLFWSVIAIIISVVAIAIQLFSK